MKVVFCTNTLNSSNHGPAKFARLLRDINSEDIGVELVTLTGDASKKTQGVYLLHEKFSKIFRPVSMLAINVDYCIGLRLVKKSFDFDLVVFNNAITGVLFKLIYGDRVNVIGMINDENSLSIHTNKSLGNLKYILRFKIFRVVEKLAARKLDMIIANSKYIEAKIIKEYKVPSEKVCLVYKGIEINKFPEYKIKQINTKEVISVLFVKSDPVVGGLEYLINALEEIKGYRIRLIIVGDHGNVEYLSRFPHLAIDYRGLLSEVEVYRIMKDEADIFCVPSIKEGLGVANMEAALHSIPIIAARVGGVPEVLVNNAWLISPESVEEIQNAFNGILVNGKTAQLMTLEAYNDISSRFSHKNSLRMFVSCMKAAMN